jgi:hypothetical protein
MPNREHGGRRKRHELQFSFHSLKDQRINEIHQKIQIHVGAQNNNSKILPRGPQKIRLLEIGERLPSRCATTQAFSKFCSSSFLGIFSLMIFSNGSEGSGRSRESATNCLEAFPLCSRASIAPPFLSTICLDAWPLALYCRNHTAPAITQSAETDNVKIPAKFE